MPTRLIRKYPNRRLYDTHASRYVSLADIQAHIRSGETLRVEDARSGEDLTRSILLQIVQEQGSEVQASQTPPLLDTALLTQLIRLHGHPLQGVISRHLTQVLQSVVEIERSFAAAPADETASASSADDPAAPSTELWLQYLHGQMPAIQRMLERYIEQSRSLFLQMQEQTQGLLETLPTELMPNQASAAGIEPQDAGEDEGRRKESSSDTEGTGGAPRR